MTIPKDPIRKEEMDKFRNEYLAAIPEKMNHLEELIKAAEKTLGEESLRNLRLFVHKIRGSAGTYGFNGVTETCRLFEGEILQKIEELKIPGEAQKNPIAYASYMQKIKKGFSNVSAS